MKGGLSTMHPDEPLLYRVPEVARLLGCTEAVVRQMIARGQLPSRRLGRRVVVLADELRAHLATLRPDRRLLAPEEPAMDRAPDGLTGPHTMKELTEG